MKKLLILLVSLLPFTATCQDTLYDKSGKPLFVKYTAEVPMPPDPVLTAVDNVDKNIVYTGTWVNGPTDATGFYPIEKPTIAYSNLANNTAKLIFDGTYLEAYLEFKAATPTSPAHGSGKLKIDNLPDTTINFGLSTSNGSRLVYKKKLPAGQHTFTLTVVGTGNVVFDYVKINGVTVAPPVIPIPPDPPPSGNVVTVTPTSGYVSAVEMSLPGTTVKFLNGTYPVTLIRVPVGVKMEAESRNAILLYNGPTRGRVDIGVIELVSGSKTDGKQSISGFTIRGNNQAAIGIQAVWRDNIEVFNNRLEEFTFSGIFIKKSVNSHIYNNNLFNTSSSDASWASGEIQIMDVKDCSVHHNVVKSDKISEGYYLKAYGADRPKEGVLENLKIYSNDPDMFPGSNWANNTAPNIGIELHDVIYAGIEIYDEKVRNTMSLASHVPPRSGTRTIVRDVPFNMKNGAYAIELVCSSITIRNCTFNGASMITANYNPNSQSNGHWTDQIFENNTVNASGPPPGWGGTHLLGMGGADMIIRNNTYINAPSNTRIKHTGPTSASNIVQSGNVPTP